MKFDNFMNDLRDLCIEHGVGMNMTPQETIEIYTLAPDDCEVFSNIVFEDVTK